MSARDSVESDAPAMRCFIGDREVTEAEAREAERLGTASVAMGGSGVVPEHLRQPGETPEQYLRPWLVMLSTSVTPPAECQHDPRYSRSECAMCGDQVSWCDKCNVDLCGCVTPPGATS